MIARLSDGGALSYDVRGDGAPLLLLRPLGGSKALWGPFAEKLAEQHRVISFDPRGVGDSSNALLSCSTRQMARDAEALLDHLAVPRAHVFGLSLGGMVASWLAVDSAARIDRLVLASTLPTVGDVPARGWRRLFELSRCMLHPGVRAELCAVRRVLSHEFRRTQPARMDEIEAAVRAHPTKRRNLILLTLAASGHHLGSAWSAVHTPTLVLMGGHDPIVGERARDDLLLHLPGASLEVIERSGHDLSLEQPAETAARTLAFLRQSARGLPNR
ncbi:MAG: alpha/beta fold hydrolase [Polyangia bacterium]